MAHFPPKWKRFRRHQLPMVEKDDLISRLQRI